MKHRTALTPLALGLALALAACGDEGESARGGHQGVEMDMRQNAGTVTDAEPDPYRDAGVGAVGTDAAPPAAVGEGREGPDTVYRPTGQQPGVGPPPDGTP